MKKILFICAVFLLLGLADLPIGYYTFLRILVSIGSIAEVVTEFKNGINFWVIVFVLISIIFNPIIPIYLDDKDAWMPIDIICAILFSIKAISLKS